MGREVMARGIEAFRERYPDLRFRILDVASSARSGKVFVEWEMTGSPAGGTVGGPPVKARGISVCDTEGTSSGAVKVVRTDVFRQPTTGELAGFDQWVRDERAARGLE